MKTYLKYINISLLFTLCMIVLPAYSINVTKEWTLAVFLNADNNLDSYGVGDMKEMSKVGSNNWLNIVVLIDREKGPAQINYIEKDNIKTVKKLGEIDMGDYHEFINFVKYVKRNYPAKHYAIVIWNHGSGWKKVEKQSVVKGISYDDSSGNHITNQQLAQSLASIHKILGRKIDVLCFDACLMQMVEVMYICKNHCLFTVASEETEPGNGAPYTDILSSINSKITPEAFAKNWASKFVASYNDGSQGMEDATQSAINCSKFDILIDAINGFAKTIMSGNYERFVNGALKNVKMYSTPENIDLKDFVLKVKKQKENDEAIKTACDKLIKAVDEVVIENGYSGFFTEGSNGIAIYLPWDYMYEPAYEKLKFAQDTLWDDMMDELRTGKTLRNITNGLSHSDITDLDKFVSKANKGMVSRSELQAVITKLNYMLYSENVLSSSVKKQAEKLLSKLKKNCN